ncbi:hypothetical protein [Paludibacterium paludis]|uniref:Uncharacterized protein n=1 Tax=Paludibacterium paludis TaxID=1225769 RepID=A0A918P5G0_9NEIS|nr:hypothetical protein [Paludibacterium paludis]GGY22654.1 hypothetical protein GCM10011289_28160 [Paludibacterium paludis]
MTCYRLAGGALTPVTDPTYIEDVEDYGDALYESGYTVMIDSEIDSVDDGASVTVYSTERADKPQFFIDVWGRETQLASLVADDFPGLVETLRHIDPLLQLIRLDQYASRKTHEDL